MRNIMFRLVGWSMHRVTSAYKYIETGTKGAREGRRCRRHVMKVRVTARTVAWDTAHSTVVGSGPDMVHFLSGCSHDALAGKAVSRVTWQAIHLRRLYQRVSGNEEMLGYGLGSRRMLVLIWSC